MMGRSESGWRGANQEERIKRSKSRGANQADRDIKDVLTQTANKVDRRKLEEDSLTGQIDRGQDCDFSIYQIRPNMRAC